MRNILFGSFALASLLMVGCGKDNPTSPTYSSVMYVNASPTQLTAPLLSLYTENLQYSNGFVAFNTNTGYLGILPGSHLLSVKQDNGTSNANAASVASRTDGYVVNEAYTMLSYDSLSSANTVKLMRLRDTLTVPDINGSKVRFWQLAPLFPSATVSNVDVTFLRIKNFLPVDSVTLVNRKFPTAGSEADNELFTRVNAGGYVIKIKSQGTQTVLVTIGSTVSTPTTAINYGEGSITVGKRKIYSFLLTGNAAGRALTYSQIANF